MAYRFEVDEEVPEAWARVAREQLDIAWAALAQRLETEGGEAIHTARKAIKKERSLLRLMRDAIEPADRRRENAALRDAARRLAGSRDADVMIATLDELAQRYAGQAPIAAFDTVRTHLQAERGPQGGPYGIAAAAAQSADELAAAAERIAGWELHRDGWRALEGGLIRTYRRGGRAFDRARRRPDDARLHDWRRRVKDLWYALRLLAPAAGPAVKGQAKDAHRLADLLGDDHDLAVLRRTLVRITPAVPADVDAVLGLIHHRRSELQGEAMLIGARVFAERPKAFRRRLSRLWRAGREEQRDAARRRPAELAEATRPAEPAEAA